MNFNLKVKPKRVSSLPKARLYSKSLKYKNMTWKQAQRRFPGLSPTGDADFDGTRNKFDCKVFDPARDGIFGRALGVVTGGKYGQSKEEYRQEREMKRDVKTAGRYKSLRESKREAIEDYKEPRERRMERIRRLPITQRGRRMHRYITGKPKVTYVMRKGKLVQKVIPAKGIITKKKTEYTVAGISYKPRYRETKAKKVRKTALGEKRSGPGRPRLSFKWRDPRTGKPIPATTYYKIKRRMKAVARTRAEQAQVRQQQVMARRGIPPQLSRQIIEQRQAQIQQQVSPQETEGYETEPETQVQEAPAQPVSRQISPYPTQTTQPQTRVIIDLMTGRPIIQHAPPKERWTED